MAQQARLLGQRGEAWFQEQLERLGPTVDLNAQVILFGVSEPNARRNYLDKYGCSKCDDWVEVQ